MWSSVRSGLSRTKTDQSSLVDTTLKPTSPLPASTAHYTGRSPELDLMMREISHDISSLVAEEQALVRSQLASKAREYCMKDISHDLRTPLNAIIGFAQMMENGALGRIENPQYIEYLRHIRESGYELLGQVEDLLGDDSGAVNSQSSPFVGGQSSPHNAHSAQNAARFEEAVA